MQGNDVSLNGSVIPAPTHIGRRARRALLVLAPSIMLTVAAHQMVQVAMNEQTVWKGGGFGMFAAIPTRYLVVGCVDTSGVSCRVDLSDSLARAPRTVRSLAQRLVSRPDRGKMVELANTLLEADFVSSQRVRTLVVQRLTEVSPMTVEEREQAVAVPHYRVARPSDLVGPDGGVRLRSVSIRVVRVQYDAATKRVWTTVMRDFALGRK